MTTPRALDETGAAGRDAFQGPWRITFDTNPDDCNLRCIMCEDHSPHSSTQSDRRAAGLPRRRMDIDLIRRVIAEAAGNGLREIIPSTMGEPLLYRHMDEIIDLCSAYGVKLNLTTNGTFPQRGARAWAERIAPVGSDVKMSWNGATRETQERVMLGSNWSEWWRTCGRSSRYATSTPGPAATGAGHLPADLHGDQPRGDPGRGGAGGPAGRRPRQGTPPVGAYPEDEGPVHAAKPCRRRQVECHGGRRVRGGGALPAARRWQGPAGEHLPAERR